MADKTNVPQGAEAAGDATAAEGAAAPEPQGTKKAKKAKEPMSVSRRSLLIGVGSTAALMGLGAMRYAGHTPLNRPPGGQDEAHLVSACIRCERCYEACPRHVIVPAKIEDGLLGMRSPMLDFETEYCDFCQEENGGVPKCVEVCPTEALVLPVGASATSTIIGRAVIDTSTCLAYRDTGCRECYDACPYEAIQLTDVSINPHPYVVEDKCNGCGACEFSCVSMKAGSLATTGATRRAIIVQPVGSY